MSDEQQLKFSFREANVSDALAVAKVHIRSWRESFAGIVPPTYLDKMSVENRAKAFENGFAASSYKMFVAETSNNEIVGFADFGRARNRQSKYEAELYAIYLLRDFQRRGIGGKLFKLIVQSVIANGINSLSLISLEASPYKSFYEKMGGRVIERNTTDIEGINYKTVVYGWDKLISS